MPPSPDISLGLTNRTVLITGGAGLIGRVVVEHFLAAGAKVASLDIAYPASRVPVTPPNFITIHCDVSNEESVAKAFEDVRDTFGPVEICIALASLDLSVLTPSPFTSASLTQLRRVLDVNVTGTWLTARAWLRNLHSTHPQAQLTNMHPNLIMIGSESGHFGERQNVEYALAKSAVQGGMLASLRAEVPRVWKGARVNVVAPGPVETERWAGECERDPGQMWREAQATTALCEPVPVKAVAMAILSLASHNFSSHVHGQVINVDGGKQGKVMWTEEEAARYCEA